MIVKNDKSEAMLQMPRSACISLQRMAFDNNIERSAAPYRYFSEELADGNVTADTKINCVSRNPYDRIFTAYVYRNFQRDPKTNIFIRGSEPNQRVLRRFEDFVMNGGLEFSVDNRRAYEPMKKFVEGIDPSKLTVVKLEDAENFKQVCSSFFGFDPAVYELPRLRKSYGRVSYSEYYTREMLDKVNTLYHDDFVMFGYNKL